MAHELGVDKVNIGLAMKIETREKLMVKFAKPGETFNRMLGRICESMVTDVKLSKAKVDEIEARIAANVKARQEKRLAEKRKNRLAKYTP